MHQSTKIVYKMKYFVGNNKGMSCIVVTSSHFVNVEEGLENAGFEIIYSFKASPFRV